jgi:glutathione S-transferase
VLREADAMQLYTHPFSPNAKRVRVMAAELGVPLSETIVDLMKGEQRAPEFLAKNPNGKVPTLEIDGRIYWESPAILFELAAKHPRARLWPAEPEQQTEALKWMFWNASHLESALFGLVFETYIKPKVLNQAPDQARIDELRANLARYAPVLDRHLEGRTFLLGEEYSIADIALATSLEFGSKTGIPLDAYPAISAWLQRVTARKSWAN